MRVLFSSMRMIGHIRPLLPYADALLNRGHDVLVAAPQDAGAILRDAGLDHAAFGHPGDKQLAEISGFSLTSLPKRLSRRPSARFSRTSMLGPHCPDCAPPSKLGSRT